MCRAGNIACSSVPNTWLTGTDFGMLRTVSLTSKMSAASFFLKDCVTVHSENLVDSADAKALAEEGKF